MVTVIKTDKAIEVSMDNLSELDEAVRKAVETAMPLTHNEKYINAVKWCSGLFDFLNKRFFENALSKPVITVVADEKCKALGWFVRKEIWKDGEADKGETEINISANFLNRPAIDIAKTMLHEMCHAFAYQNGIQDCSRSGTYHNKLFAEIGRKHGLAVKKVAVYGWTGTTLTEDSRAIITPYVENVKLLYRLNLNRGARVKSSSTRKYMCPLCGQSVRATKSVNIICADCDEPIM